MMTDITLGAAPTRRAFLGGAVAAAAATTLASCFAGERPDDSDDAALQVWGALPPESGPGAVVEAFQERFPQYRVDYTRYVNDADGNLKLDSALQGGLNIDVYFTYRADYLALRTPLCADLTELIKGDSTLAPLLQNEGIVYQPGGTALAISTNYEPYLIARNMDAGAAAGLDVPTDWTLDEFVDSTRNLARQDMYGAYTIPDTARIQLGPNYWYAANGSSNFGHPAFTEWLALGQDLINDEVLYPWTSVLSQTQSSYQQSAFTTGEFAQWVIPPALVRYLHDPEYPHDFKVAATPIPSIPDSESYDQGLYNNQIMIHPQTNRMEAAWEFVKFWLTEGGGEMLRAGKIPVVGDYSEDEILEGILGEDAEDHFDVDSFRNVIFAEDIKLSTDTEFDGYAEISSVVQQERDSCWINEKTPEAAAEAMRVAADTAIANA